MPGAGYVAHPDDVGTVAFFAGLIDAAPAVTTSDARIKARLHTPKLNTEALRKVAPRSFQRVMEHDEEFATEISQAILVSHLVKTSGRIGNAVGTLYFVNTLGAGAACLAGATGIAAAAILLLGPAAEAQPTTTTSTTAPPKTTTTTGVVVKSGNTGNSGH